MKYVLIEPKGKSTETLGEGAYGVVYKAKLIGSSGAQMFALKKIKVESENEGISSSALREITLLNQLDHENVIKLVDVEMIPDRLNLIFDLMELDLKKDMDSQKHIPMSLKTVMVLKIEKINSFWRGNYPLFFSVLHGSDHGGISVHPLHGHHAQVGAF